MSKKGVIPIIIVASLLSFGLIFAAIMQSHNWDFSILSSARYESSTYRPTGEFSNIIMRTDTEDITFIPSDQFKVVCAEEENFKHSVEVRDGTLTIETLDDRKWYEHISLCFDNSKIAIYIPQGEYGLLSINSDTGDIEIPSDFTFKSIDIEEDTGKVTNYASALEEMNIKTTTGDIEIKNLTSGTLSLSVSTGCVTVSDVSSENDVKIDVSTGKAKITDTKCKSVISSGGTGDISLENVIATESFSIKRSTGDIRFDGSDANEIFVETDTGDVTGSLLTNKVFLTQTDTGRINVPKTITGGRCEITTDTGDIRITID